jgi:hypothetical protein
VAAEHRLDVVHLDFVRRWAINTRPVLIRLKIPLAFTFSNSRNKPVFDVRFLAAKTILWITSTNITEKLPFILILTCDLYSWFYFTQWVKVHS